MVTTRLIKDHQDWIGHGYQIRSVRHLMERRAAALFLDPGLGKTAIVLEAFRQLKEAGMVERMLVVAPLRVVQLVWQQEGRKWTQFRDLTFSLLHGGGGLKEERLREKTDIHLINPEGIPWLSQQYFGQQLPYDIVTIDELTKFKNAQAQRSKQLRKKLTHAKYRWGLTGSPAPNGYMDLFGQMLILDDGASLGRFITYFRDQYFTKGYTGFDYELKPDGGARIETRIAPYVLRMSADDYLELPKLITHVIEIDLDKKSRKQYDEMRKEMILALPEGTVTAANSGAVYSKLAQMANGAVYMSDSTYIELHTAKLDALEDLVEELAGQPLLVGYEFRHDLDRLQERFPGTPTLTGLSHKRIVELEAAWNAGEIPVMFAHPASAGHGLNLQGSGASHVCWFSRPWDLDLYDQFIRRLLRQGTTAQHIVNHVLVVKDSIDEIKGTALQDKDVTQQRLLTALNAEIIRDTSTKGDNLAIRKLGFQGQANTATAAAPAGAVQPKGWGAPAAAPAENGQQAAPAAEEPAKTPRGWGAPAAAEPSAGTEQRELINEKLRAPEPAEDGEQEEVPVTNRALEAFGAGVVQQLGGAALNPADATGAAPTPRGWGAAEAASAADPLPENPADEVAPRRRRNVKAAVDPALPGSERTVITGSGDNFGDIVTPVHIDISGLPLKVVAAALRAIADAYSV